jgi:hypothetical protein
MKNTQYVEPNKTNREPPKKPRSLKRGLPKKPQELCYKKLRRVLRKNQLMIPQLLKNQQSKRGPTKRLKKKD